MSESIFSRNVFGMISQIRNPGCRASGGISPLGDFGKCKENFRLLTVFSPVLQLFLLITISPVATHTMLT